jgi:lysozyme
MHAPLCVGSKWGKGFMQPRHRVSRTAIDLIKRFEGYRRAAAQLPDGRWTIGHGHTLTARQGAEVSEDDAEALLLYDLIGVAHALNEAVYTPLNQNQFDALASFTFNIGLDSFHQSGVLKRLNEGALIQAACSMELWRKAIVGGERIVIDALVRRRSVEKTLFLTPEGEAWVPAPSPILRPLLDTDAQDIVPLQAPVEVTAVLEGDQLVVHREDQPEPAPVAPDDDDEAEGPARTAAEAVTQRLSTIFPEPDLPEPGLPEPSLPEQDVPEADEESAEAPPAVDPHLAQADFAPPAAPPSATLPEIPSPLEDPVPFFLRAPEIDPGLPEADDLEAHEEEEGPESHDLFRPPPPEFRDAAEDDEAEYDEDDRDYDEADAADRGRYVIDDLAPYDFGPPVSRPLPERPEGGLLTLIGLAVLGLIFFGGGIFWATYARATGPHLFSPRLVGGLAGVAGVGFFVVAVYLLLDRLGRASEREARSRP